jgi:hypothetical protein
MEPEEILAEVARRKKRAEELGIRETLWSLYCHLCNYKTWLHKDPDLVYPEVGKTLEFLDDQPKFALGQTRFHIISKEQPAPEMEYLPPGAFEPDECTRGALSLRVNDQKVFKFERWRSTAFQYEGPVVTDHLGEITSFIEGPWVTELADLLREIEAHRRSVQDKREASKKTQELEDLQKRFGV